MKRYSTYITCLWLTIGTLLLSACSADVQEAAAVVTPTAETDSYYINLRIENSTRMTRSTEAATAEENAIYDGILCIFEGAEEATATLKTAVVIDQLINNPGNSTSVDITQRLATGTHPYTAEQHLYVLALLNTTPSGFTVGGTDNNELCFNGTSKTGNTVSQIQSLTINSVGSIDEHVGLFMRNSSGLVEATALFDTEAAARASGASRVTIPVERVAAKVTVINDIPAATTLSNIDLIGASSAHPLIHSMSWTLASELSNGGATGGDVFSLYEETSHQSGDVLYLRPTSSPTDIIVEVQLKDGSFLLDDCYGFPAYYTDKLYTSMEELISFYRSGWEGQKGNYTNDGIRLWTEDQVFLNAKVSLLATGKVDVDLLSGKSGLSPTARSELSSLSTTLANFTTLYRNGKMYYTFTVSELVSNNAYNLRLVEKSSTDSRQTVITFKLDQGISTGATFSYSTGSLFAANSVTAGANLATQTLRGGQTLFQPTTYYGNGGDADNNIDFMVTPADGWTFTPNRVSFNTTKWGTDGGEVDVAWVGDGGTTTPLATGVKPNRDNATPSYLAWNSPIPATDCTGPCGLRLNLYKLGITKQVGFSDVVIEGTLSKTSEIDDPKKSIKGIGRDKPIEN